MDTDSCIIYIKAKDVYEDIANIIEIRFDTLNYEVNRPLTMKKKQKKKEIRLMKDKLGGKIMTEFLGLRPEIYFYLIDDGNRDRKAKRTKTFAVKWTISFHNHKTCLLNKKSY